jgi:hypothetical protein
LHGGTVRISSGTPAEENEGAEIRLVVEKPAGDEGNLLMEAGGGDASGGQPVLRSGGGGSRGDVQIETECSEGDGVILSIDTGLSEGDAAGSIALSTSTAPEQSGGNIAVTAPARGGDDGIALSSSALCLSSAHQSESESDQAGIIQITSGLSDGSVGGNVRILAASTLAEEHSD